MAAASVVIVGGGGAGDSAAFGLREQGFDGEILVVSSDGDRPYDRPYLSKEFIRGEVDRNEIYLRGEADYATARIDLRLKTTVTGGDLQARRLFVDRGPEIKFETLLLATGGTPRRLPGVPAAENVLSLRSMIDAMALREALRSSRRLLLIGAGFIGAEVAASARAMGKEVLMVEAAPVPLARALGEEVGEVYAGIHRSRGVDVRTGTTVADWHTKADRVTAATLSDGSRHEVDVVLIGVGIEPNLAVASSLGLPIESGGVSVDESLRVTDGLYCAGDIAVHRHPVLGRPVRVEHWEVAKGQGAAVGASITGGAQPYATLPYFWSDQYDVSLEYRGSASAEHQLVWRGDRDKLRFSVFYMRDGLIDGVLSMNDGETNSAAEELIKDRRPVDPAALADAGSELPGSPPTPRTDG